MDFEVPSTGSKLTFDEGPYKGLEVTVDEAPVGLLLDIMENYSKLAGAEIDMNTAAAVFPVLLGGFASVLEGWNATRKGEPVPPTLEGLRSLGQSFVLTVIGAWLTGKTQAGEELGKDSGSGANLPEVLTAAAALSSSLPNSGPQRLLSGSATAGTACRRSSLTSPRGCYGCSTSTSSDTGTRNRRGVNRTSRTTTSRSASRPITARLLTLMLSRHAWTS